MSDEPIRRYSRKPNPYLVPVVGGGIAVGLLSAIVALSLVLFNGGSRKNVVATDAGVKQFAERLKTAGAIEKWEPASSVPHDGIAAVNVQSKDGATGRILEYAGEIDCERKARSLSWQPELKNVVTVGRFLLISDNSAKFDFQKPVVAATTGAKVWTLDDRGVDAKDYFRNP